jgi:vacuolar-type H+-ATPase subunit H
MNPLLGGPKFFASTLVKITGRTDVVKEEILVKLRSAEEETARRIAAAKERAAETIKQARLETDWTVETARLEARKTEEQRVAQERARLEMERERILTEGQKQEQALRASYQKKVTQHVEKALASFERNA